MHPIDNKQIIDGSKLVISPMAGVTDAPFRYIAKKYGADYGITEMITSQTHLWTSNKSQRRLKSNFIELPKIIQISGTTPQMFANAAKSCEQNGADAVEINMGCPAKKVCNVIAGSALLKDINLVEDILYSTVNNVKIPIYLKTRLGWDNENKNILEVAKIAQNAGIKLLAIHGRTREQKYDGDADYQLIAEVKKQVNIPIFANGDINTPEKALHVLRQTKCDGLYIGRGALGKPWLFQQIKNYLKFGKYQDTLLKNVIKQIMLEHINLIHEHYGVYIGVRVARKHVKWYLQANPNLSENGERDFADFVLLDQPDQQISWIYQL